MIFSTSCWKTSFTRCSKLSTAFCPNSPTRNFCAAAASCFNQLMKDIFLFLRFLLSVEACFDLFCGQLAGEDDDHAAGEFGALLAKECKQANSAGDQSGSDSDGPRTG